MSLATVKAFLTEHAPDLLIHETEASTATVALAAQAHGVEPGQIAKTLSVWIGSQPALVLMAGDTRLDNPKFKAWFKTKARMLSADEVVHWTGHPVGGVCPFGLAHPLPIYADQGLRRFQQVLPAAGSTNSALKIDTERLISLVKATWVDVAQDSARGV